MSYLIEICNVCDDHLSIAFGDRSKDFPSHVRDGHLRMFSQRFVWKRRNANLPAFDTMIEPVEEVGDMRELALLRNSYGADTVRLEFKSKATVQWTRRKEGPIAADNIAKFNQRENWLFLGQSAGCLHCPIGAMAGEQDRLSSGDNATAGI